MRRSRREFIRTVSAAGSGLVLGFYLPSGCRREHSGEPFAPNAWLRIGSDESVTVLVDRAEMGQGVSTSLPMLLAEELEADWATIRMEFAPAAERRFGNPLLGGWQATGDSTSVRAAFTPLRQAGAAAREVLITAAALTWRVERSECRAERGAIVHAATQRRLTYGALADRAATLPVPRDVPLKARQDWKIVGTRVKRLDTPSKVDGSAVFGIDVQVPGMLVALVARCPVFGGTLSTYDATETMRIPGVRHVARISSGVAVVADGYWPAKRGRDALRTTWHEGPNATLSSAAIATQLAQSATRPGTVARLGGDPARALAGSLKRADATYQLPLLAHATMEPMNCTAYVRADGVDIWAPTQLQAGARGLAARELGAEIGGVPLGRVRVHSTFLGGGFGRRFEGDFVREALETSKAVGVPVKVIWSREDDIQHDFYRPASYHQLRGALDLHGRPTAWTHRVVAPSILRRLFGAESVKDGLDREATAGAVGMPYEIPNVLVDFVEAEIGVPVGYWRSVNDSFNAFAVESFIDELAASSHADPYAFRRGLLSHEPRYLGALDLAATKAGWGAPIEKGRARGMAVWRAYGSYIAQVAEVSVGRKSGARVDRVICAVDCGQVVNPDTVEAQMQGGIVYGLSAALTGAITIDEGRVQQSNFHDYPILQMKDMPTIEVYAVPSDAAPGGVGELATPPIAPAVCNAIYAATGRRVRTLPIGKVA